MKKIYFLLLAFGLFQNLEAQVINFTGAAALKGRLLSANTYWPFQHAKDLNGNYVKIDANSNNEIEVSEALNISYLNLIECGITSLEGIQYFANLENILFGHNPIASVGTVLDNLVNLKHITCRYTAISHLNLEPHPILEGLSASGMANLTSIDLSGMHNLKYLYLDNCNSLISVDVSDCYNMIEMSVSNCRNLQALNIKNGINEDCNFGYCDNLRYICCDDVQLSYVTGRVSYDAADDCEVNTYCSLNPGGLFYVIKGNEKFDIDRNGCTVTDPSYRNLKFTLRNMPTTPTYDTFFGDANGVHTFGVGAGTHILTPVLENPTYFIISPSSVTVNFPATSSPAIRDFCIQPNGVHPDLEIVMLPIEHAIPGFTSNYKIVYKNNGNQIQSGNINLAFDDNVLDFVGANPTTLTQNTNSLIWSFSNLLPFESREILLVLNVNSPMDTPAVNGGDLLDYTVTITDIALSDDTPINNTFQLEQTVVNSFDPNDKTCLEGTTISTAEVGEYVHYMIRFENTGTFPAKNIIIVDNIDTTKFSIGTLVPLSGSHPFMTRLKGDKLEFVFENINLPFDDAYNDGYVAFKIKTKSTLVAGNTFSNKASIYFDYNFPIVTNTATTVIQTLANPDFEFYNHFILAPNPVEDVLTIHKKSSVEITSLSIYNTLGQLVLTIIEPNSVIDVSNLKSGNYYVKVMSALGSSSAKFIKK